jgi:hypothetical protein
MQSHRLLMKAIVVLALASMVHVTASDHVAAEGPRDAACAACFTEPHWCEGNEDEACEIACGTWAVGECNAYDPEEVACQTTLQVYDYVVCA